MKPIDSEKIDDALNLRWSLKNFFNLSPTKNKTKLTFLQMLPTEFNLFVEKFSMTIKNLELISLQIWCSYLRFLFLSRVEGFKEYPLLIVFLYSKRSYEAFWNMKNMYDSSHKITLSTYYGFHQIFYNRNFLWNTLKYRKIYTSFPINATRLNATISVTFQIFPQ
jgi:hypothetical protein